jgi:tRNA (guanine37-N1)-methyltransferase
MGRFLKEALKDHLKEEEIRKLYASFDIVGDIAVFKVPKELERHKYVIGNVLLEKIKPVKSVWCQVGPVSGEYRIRELEHVAGENRSITLYKEHGCLFKVDILRVYFSPRLSAERLRVAELVDEGEVVFNMFAGVGTFSIVIAKKNDRVKVYSSEINPDAYELMLENIKLNKVKGKVIPLLGDAILHAERLRGQVDRVLMPLPERAKEFLPKALQTLRGRGWIHYYTHIHYDRGEDPVEKAKMEVKGLEAVFGRVVREVGPRLAQVVLDLRVDKAP